MATNGEIAGVKKKYVIIGGVGLAGIVIVVVYMRSKGASTANTNSVTDPDGNVCAAVDPNSGFCPGTPGDLAYQSQAGTALGANSASYVGGQVIGYDGYGNPIYSSSAPVTGPGSYVNNAEWAQAAQQYLIQQEPNADPSVIGAALGAYITGAPVTADQRQIIEQAIAFQGKPPVAGTNGDPPNINETATTTNVTVPNVVGKTAAAAQAQLMAAGFTVGLNGSGTVVSQSPVGGSKAAKGSRVDLHAESAPATVSAPSRVTGLATSGNLVNGAELHWTAAHGATNYELVVQGAGGKNTGTTHIDRTIGGTSTHVDLTPGRYQARVRVAGNAHAAWSSWKPFTVKR